MHTCEHWTAPSLVANICWMCARSWFTIRWRACACVLRRNTNASTASMRLNIYLYFDRVDMPKREYKWRRTKCHTNSVFCFCLFRSNFDGLAVHKQRLPRSDKRRFRWGKTILQRNSHWKCAIDAPIQRTFEWAIHSIVESLVTDVDHQKLLIAW